MLFDHIGFKVSDFASARHFFVQALQPLGFGVTRDGDGWAMLGRKGDGRLWIGASGASPGPLHLAFSASTREQVRRFHAAALRAGGRDNGAPGLRAHYHADYYGAFVIGPDGHNIEAVCRQAEPQPFTFRTATPDDALCLSVLATQVFLDTYATRGVQADLAREATKVYAVAEFSRRLGDPCARIIVVEQGGYLAGFMDLSFGACSPVASVQGVEVLRLYLQRPFQGMGLGRQLMARAEDEARTRKASHVWLTAWAGNARALRFYPALGYADLGSTAYVIEGEAYENRVFARRITEPPA